MAAYECNVAICAASRTRCMALCSRIAIQALAGGCCVACQIFLFHVSSTAAGVAGGHVAQSALAFRPALT